MNKKIHLVTIGYRLPKLLAGGSILQHATDYDTIWGVGLRTDDTILGAKHLDIRAVRGPITRRFLVKNGFSFPEIYGDPALLLPLIFPEFKIAPVVNRIGVVPHYRTNLQKLKLSANMMLISPMRSPITVVNEILSCELILATSLHGLIVAEAFGIPARWYCDDISEPELKFFDYYESTNRSPKRAPNLSIAESLGGEPKISNFNFQALLASFPRDLPFSLD